MLRMSLDVAEGSTDVAYRLATTATCMRTWLMRGDDSAGNLSPLSDDLPPELRKLAQFLRRHFHIIGTSVRGYALQNNWDPGAVSRFLSGERIPPQSFVDTLLADAGPQRSPDEVEQEQTEGVDLRLRALHVRNARQAMAEQIAQDLANAEQEINLLKAKERVLTKALLEAEAKNESLYQKYQAMQEEIQYNLQQTAIPAALGQLADERGRTEREIIQLKEELELERAARIAAEQRRDMLQSELDKTDAQLVRAGGAASTINSYNSQRQLLVAMRGRKTRWGGVVSLIAVPILIYGAPVYLGLIYHTLTRGQSALKVMTVSGLFVPVWFALAIMKVEQPEADGKAGKILWLIVLTAAIFFTAALV